MKVVLCDDQRSILKEIDILLNKFHVDNEAEIELIYFDKPSKLYNYLKEEKVDIIFMDLDFSDTSEDGILWAKKIKEKFSEVMIIILTAYENRYKEGYEAKAFRFMTKPVNQEELYDYLRAAMEELQLVHSISIVRRGIPRNILVKDICYFSAQSGGSELWTVEDMYCCEESLLRWEEKLPEKIFFRCHSKYLVNMSHVVDFDKQILVLDNGEKLPVSRRRWKAFQLAYMKFDTRRFGSI